RFAIVDDQPVQIVDDLATLRRLNVVNLASSSDSNRETEANRIIRQELSRPFKIASDRLWRATLIQLRSDEHLLLLAAHRLVCDEVSSRVLLRDLAQVYPRLAAGDEPGLPEPTMAYRDFAKSQRQSFREEPSLAFWKQQLTALPPTTEL